MGRRHIVTSAVGTLVVVSASVALLVAAPVAAQRDAREGALFVSPIGPAAEGFDISRFGVAAHGTFVPFTVTETRPVREALDQKVIAADTDVLVTDTPEGLLALLTEQMAYHHIAQGRSRDHDWLVTFCVVCNSAAQLTPVVQGRSTTFDTVGVYDGMMVMQDKATGTLWNHITGEAYYGPAVGTSLGPPHNVLHLKVDQLLKRDPDARIAISDRVYYAGGRRHGTVEGLSAARVFKPEQRNGLGDAFAATLGMEDTRRPRMDLGLGVWSDTGSRYYPRERIQKAGAALIDELDGRKVLVYVDPVTSTPAAIFVDATSARKDGKIVRLDDGSIVRDGALYDSRGQRIMAERPLQIFTRWYGFSSTFRETSIFGES